MPAAAQRVELAWKLEAGTELVYRQSMQSETGMPQGMGTSSMRSESTQRWTVLEVDGDGNATVRVTTEQAQMSLDGPLGASGVDPADRSWLRDVSRGSRGACWHEPHDRLRSAGSRDRYVRPQGDARGAAGAGAGSLHPGDVDSMLSDEALRGQGALESLPLPTEAVGIGSTWDSNYTSAIPTFGSMTAVTSHRVESMDGDLVVIGSSGTMSVEDGGATSLPFPLELGDTTIVATSRFDAGRGLLLGTESTMRLQASMAIGGQEIVIGTVITSTLELIEGGVSQRSSIADECRPICRMRHRRVVRTGRPNACARPR